MKRFLFFTDSHFRDDKTKTRIDDAYKAQFEKLGEILQIVREYNIDAIYHGGDYFNTKKPSHQLVGDMIDWCKHVAVPISVVIGNHDVTGYNLDSVRNSGLGVLFESGAMEPLKEDVYEEDKIVFKAVHTSLNFQQNYLFPEKYNDYVKIVISHNYVIPSESMPWGFIHPRDINTNATLVLCGHYHVPFEYETATTKWINPGPLCRWKITEKDHKPAVLLIEVDAGKVSVEKILLQSAKPGDETFDVEVVGQEKQREKDIQSFVKSLEQTSFTSIDIEETVKQVGAAQNIEPEILDEIIKRIRIAKDVLK